MRVKLCSGIASVQIVADGDGLVSRAGTALVVGLADRVGLTGALSGALWDVRERRSRHDPGRVVRDLAVMLADGGDCLTDLRVLRDQGSCLARWRRMRRRGDCWTRWTRSGWTPSAGRGQRRGSGHGGWARVPRGSRWISTR
jgi:hypothetical protein